MEILVANKVELIETLSTDLHILQHAQADGVINQRVYKLLIACQPEAACIQLIDRMISGGEGTSTKFLRLLQKQEILDTYTQLRELKSSFALPGKNRKLYKIK